MTLSMTQDFAFPTQTALFLDFDGTLVGFKDDPEAVHLTQAQTTLLMRLSYCLSGALALISGRDLRDLSKRTPNTLWRLGNHGLYRAAPGQMPPNEAEIFSLKIREGVALKLATFSGVWIEGKGPLIAIHHRANPEAGADIYKIVAALIEAHEPPDTDLRIQRGHNVIEIKPAAANKGKGLTTQMGLAPFSGRTPIMIGDDTTDEDGFVAAQKLGGFGIKIGEGATQAKYRLPNTADLYTLLGTLI